MAGSRSVMAYLLTTVCNAVKGRKEVSIVELCKIIMTASVGILVPQYKNVRVVQEPAKVRTICARILTWAAGLDNTEVEALIQTRSPEVWLAEANTDRLNFAELGLSDDVMQVIAKGNSCTCVCVVLHRVLDRLAGNARVLTPDGKSVVSCGMMTCKYCGPVTARASVVVNIASKRVFAVTLPAPMTSEVGTGYPHGMLVLTLADNTSILFDPTIGQFMNGLEYALPGVVVAKNTVCLDMPNFAPYRVIYERERLMEYFDKSLVGAVIKIT